MVEINVPNIIDAALQTRDDRRSGNRNNNSSNNNHSSSSSYRHRNVAVLSSNMGPNHNEQGFLSDNFPRGPARLYVTAESDDFDMATLNEWRAEGFDVRYLAMGESGDDAFKRRLEGLSRGDDLGPCENFGIIAYGDAASACLEHYHILDNNPEFKLCCLVAYYPTRIPEPRGQFPSSIQVLVHLAGDEVGVLKQSQMIGIQGKKRLTKQKVDRGLGAGGIVKLAYPAYAYAGVEPGFAERDLDEYDRRSAELAWSRSLRAVRKAFGRHVDLESVVEQNVESKFFTPNLGNMMSTYTFQKSPHVTYVPTLTGGIGAQELQRFYSDYFLRSNPPSLKLTLLSRTVGADRVVDELHVSFKHTQEMPWILPGIPPTNKKVEIIVVSIVTLRGGKLYHEHIYWDQASVLVQTGLLDPKLVPSKAAGKGVKRLPVVGKTAARRVLKGAFEDAEDGEEEGEADNEMIPGYYSDDDDDDNGVTGQDTKADEKGRDDNATGKENGARRDNTSAKKDDQAGQRTSSGAQPEVPPKEDHDVKGKGPERTPGPEAEKPAGTNSQPPAQDGKPDSRPSDQNQASNDDGGREQETTTTDTGAKGLTADEEKKDEELKTPKTDEQPQGEEETGGQDEDAKYEGAGQKGD
ncbi:hypothetical protein F4778DRAFT_753672, partial [Xylariomycetidae sp. FL2044]